MFVGLNRSVHGAEDRGGALQIEGTGSGQPGRTPVETGIGAAGEWSRRLSGCIRASPNGLFSGPYIPSVGEFLGSRRAQPQTAATVHTPMVWSGRGAAQPLAGRRPPSAARSQGGDQPQAPGSAPETGPGIIARWRSSRRRGLRLGGLALHGDGMASLHQALAPTAISEEPAPRYGHLLGA